jgi:hypothetical protein
VAPILGSDKQITNQNQDLKEGSIEDLNGRGLTRTSYIEGACTAGDAELDAPPCRGKLLTIYPFNPNIPSIYHSFIAILLYI